MRGIKGCEASIAERVQGLIGSGNDWSMWLTEGLVRTSRAPCLSCAAGGLERKKRSEGNNENKSDNGAQVAMEPGSAQHPL